jgi:hypothetical protein
MTGRETIDVDVAHSDIFEMYASLVQMHRLQEELEEKSSSESLKEYLNLETESDFIDQVSWAAGYSEGIKQDCKFFARKLYEGSAKEKKVLIGTPLYVALLE